MAETKDMGDISDRLAIATTTFYNPTKESDVERVKLAMNTVRNAVNLGYDISVVDGGSPDSILEDFDKLGARVYKEATPGMGAGRRQAIQEAMNSGKEIIAWMEPEKDSYVSEIHKTVQHIISGEADMVVPNRGKLNSYPTAQQYAEPLGNAFWNALTGHKLDMWSGPRTWKRELSDYFLNYNGEHGDKWDSIFIPVMDAIIDNKKVVSVDVNYVHPKSQTDLENKDPSFYHKRVYQLQNLFGALQTHWDNKYHK